MISLKSFVPDHYYSFITVKVQARNVKTSLFHVVIVHQISILDRALPASACPFYTVGMWCGWKD